MKPIKYAVAFVVYSENRKNILIVQRPPEDEDLPDIWGLPAGSVREDETFEQAVIRAGRDKLGVELQIVEFIGRDDIERDDFILHMEEYEAKIIRSEPVVPQPISGITQYQEWCWGTEENLKPAAERGSLCSRILLENEN